MFIQLSKVKIDNNTCSICNKSLQTGTNKVEGGFILDEEKNRFKSVCLTCFNNPENFIKKKDKENGKKDRENKKKEKESGIRKGEYPWD